METTAVTAEQVILFIEARLQEHNFGMKAYQEQLISHVGRAQREGFTAHWARVINQTAEQLAQASSKAEALKELVFSLRGNTES